MLAISFAKMGSSELIFLCSLYLNTVLTSIEFFSLQEQKITSILRIKNDVFCLKIKL